MPVARRTRLLPTVAVAGVMAGFLWFPRPVEQPSVYLAEFRTDAAVQLARQELMEAIDQTKAREGLRLPEWFLGSRPAASVVAGTPDNAAVVELAEKYGVVLPRLAPEEYLIQPLPQASAPRALVAGGDALGLAYGLMSLAEDLRLRRPYLETPLPVRRAPNIKLRLVSDPLDPTYPGPSQALRWGYNAVMTEPWPALVLYEKVAPTPYDPEKYGGDRAWVEERRQRAHTQIAQAKALHLKVLAPGDVLSFPTQMMELHGREVSDGIYPQRYCIERPRVQALLAAAIDELFTEFPQLDGIVVRTGENYPLGPLAGNPPQEGRCGLGGTESLRRTWELLHDLVVRRHGKLLILRAWDLGVEGTHAQLRLAQNSAEPVIPNPSGVTFSYKITETDFWRYNRLNPNLLRPDQPRMVEFQAAREYEGKGAFPNYVAGIYANGPPELPGSGGLGEAYRAGVRQAWVWAKGGGWNGPYLDTYLWVEANVYAMSRLLWDVEADPNTLALDWARLRFGDGAAAHLAALLQKSPQAVLKGFYPQCYAQARGPWAPNALWVRDDIITGGYTVTELYKACRNDQGWAKALRDQEEALALVASMQADLSAARPFLQDARLYRELEVSLEYQRSLLEVLHNYLTGLFQLYRFQDSRGQDAEAARIAREALLRLSESWRVHSRVVANLPGAATPYRDAGMLATAEAALRELEGPR